MKRWIVMAAATMLATPGIAQDKLREFCGDRPGIGTPACTVDKGHFQVEVGLVDWTLDKSAGSRTDTVLTGDASLRLGVTDTTELRLGWTAFGHVRDREDGSVAHANGIGDVTVGVKQNLMSPDGDGFSLAVLPFATLPAGHGEVGAGTWGAGLIVPVGYELNDAFQLEFTPEVDAAPDEDRHARHLAYSATVGLIAKASDKLSVTAEIQPLRDRDPEGHETQLLTGLSAGYMAKDQLQLDAGVNAGLNRHTPDVELYAGISEKF